jgi:hypothetical protein
VTVIADYAFAQSFNLKSVNLGSGVTTIGLGAFGLTGLESVSLPASLTSIGTQAFTGCSNLTSVSIPASVTSIGGQAFYYCPDLTTVCMQATTPPTLGSAAFYNCNLTTIYVPNDKVGDYKAAPNWSAYEGIIKGFEYISLGDNVDNSARIEWWKNKVANVTLSGRTLWKDGDWNTLVLPFNVVDGDANDDVTFSGTPLAGAEARSLTSASVSGTTLNLTFSNPVTELVAGTPYIIKWAKDTEHPTIVSPEFTAEAIDATDRSYDSNDKPDIATDTRVRFIGTYDPKTFTDEDKNILFLGTGNQLFYPQPKDGQNPTLGAQRAYFKIGNGEALVSRLTAFNIDYGDDVIDNVGEMKNEEMKNEQLADAWYDMSGRKIVTSSNRQIPRGIYIHNGTKIVIK